MWWLAVGSVMFLGVIGALVPQLSRPTVPLGVDVPSGYVDHPIVRDAVGRYRIGVAWLTLAVLPVLAGAAAAGLGEAAASSLTLVAVLGMVLGITVVMRRASTPIRSAKRTQDWYGDAPVAIIASVTGATDPAGRVRWAWHGAAPLLVLGLGGYAVARYGAFVDPMATHSGWNGPDQWAPKSWPVVLAPLGIALAMVAAVAVMAAMIARQTPRILPGGDPAAARVDASRRAALAQRLVGLTNLLTAATFGALALVRWHGATTDERPLLVAILVVPLLVVGGTLVGMMGARGAGLHGAAKGVTGGPESPDQDDLWKLGAFYYAPDDPRLMVEKRMGLGLTINFGHPAGEGLRRADPRPAPGGRPRPASHPLIPGRAASR